MSTFHLPHAATLFQIKSSCNGTLLPLQFFFATDILLNGRSLAPGDIYIYVYITIHTHNPAVYVVLTALFSKKNDCFPDALPDHKPLTVGFFPSVRNNDVSAVGRNHSPAADECI